MSEVDCNKLIESNKGIASKEFDRFKSKNGLPANAKIEDVLCQRLLKTSYTKEGKWFNKYHGLTVVIPLPEETSSAVFTIAKHIEDKLDKIGLSEKFIFVPRNTYHITLMGIVERPSLAISEEEIECYSKIINKANTSITKSAPISVSIDKVQYYDDFILYIKVKFDREPLNTIDVFNRALGNSTLYTGSYHITLAYQLSVLSQEQKEKIANIVLDVAKDQFVSVGVFKINQAQLSVFNSMSSYRAVTDTVLKLS